MSSRIQDLRGNIRVFARVRPLLPFEKAKGCKNCVKFERFDEVISLVHLQTFGCTQFLVFFWGHCTGRRLFHIEQLLSRQRTITYSDPNRIRDCAHTIVSECRARTPVTFACFQVTVKNVRKQRENSWEFDKVGYSLRGMVT